MVAAGYLLHRGAFSNFSLAPIVQDGRFSLSPLGLGILSSAKRVERRFRSAFRNPGCVGG